MRLHCLALSVLLLGGACSSRGAVASFTPVRGSQISGELPDATGSVVLDVLHGDAVSHSLDMALLGQLETVDLVVLEPFLDQEHTYTGVPVSSLLSAIGLGDAANIRFVALDDYVVTLSAQSLTEAILATHQDGQAIAVADGGPIRVIYAPGSEVGRNTDNWIWSVRTMAAA